MGLQKEKEKYAQRHMASRKGGGERGILDSRKGKTGGVGREAGSISKRKNPEFGIGQGEK